MKGCRQKGTAKYISVSYTAAIFNKLSSSEKNGDASDHKEQKQ